MTQAWNGDAKTQAWNGDAMTRLTQAASGAPQATDGGP